MKANLQLTCSSLGFQEWQLQKPTHIKGYVPRNSHSLIILHWYYFHSSPCCSQSHFQIHFLVCYLSLLVLVWALWSDWKMAALLWMLQTVVIQSGRFVDSQSTCLSMEIQTAEFETQTSIIKWVIYHKVYQRTCHKNSHTAATIRAVPISLSSMP